MLRNVPTLAFACAPLAAVAQQPVPYEAARTSQIAATVQTISPSDRHVTLLGNDGTRLTVAAGRSVTNFNEVKPGDKVLVIYREGLIAEAKPKGRGAPGAKPSTSIAPADQTQPTASPADLTKSTTVRINAVDPSEHTVTFTRPDGERRTMSVMRSDAMQFIETLRPGDEVQITYREAVAVSIEPNRG